MQRRIYSELLNWKASKYRKPLILKGARQVGKSWILKEFGKNEFKYLAYISCDNSEFASSLFKDYNVKRILESVEAITKTPVVPGETLIVFDEIQEISLGLSALKYLCEEASEYHVAVAGSLLGITLRKGISFPVGKVDFLEMYPMDFEEFLWALGEYKLGEIIDKANIELLDVFHSKFEEHLRQYYFCGGMPEAVLSYIQGRGVLEVRKIQNNILEAYRNDISKHAPLREAERIHLVMRSLPAQLAKENKKFIYSAIRKGARASEFEIAIQWLIDAGILYKISRISSPSLPLKFYEDFNAFKLYLLDCGLYGAMSDTEAAVILLKSDLYREFKGTLSELYVCQQLMAIGKKLYYYSAEDSRVEIDYIIEKDNRILPIEVKAEGNVKGKSLKIFMEKNNLRESVRFSMLPYKRQENILNLPLYTTYALEKYI
ncbi:MAG: ATP-binding protein [Muribaculaceae bacterium]|nr:ATP-binding protein [Muribaculaceae bacterium]